MNNSRKMTGIFSRWLGASLLVLALAGNLSGQSISNEQLFGVQGYSVFERGYPFGVMSGPNGRFFLLEYWIEGKEGRPATNYYLQNYGNRDYVEHWFRPITEPGDAPMIPVKMMRTRECAVIIGRQFREEEKETHTVARFFSFDGTPTTTLPVQLSTYSKLPKRFTENFSLSPQRKRLMWMGVGEASFFFSVWDERGKKVWDKELTLPYVKDKYLIRQVEVTDRGDLIMLVLPVTPLGVPRERSPLLILRYRYEKETFETYDWPLEKEAVPLMMNMVLEGNTVYVSGSISQPEANGFFNQMNLGKNDPGRPMTHIVFRKLDEMEDGLLKATATTYLPVPVNWVANYQQNGAHFKEARLVTTKDHVILMMEEVFVEKDRFFYYDIACVSFHPETGKVNWNQLVPKKQRDKQSGAFLSYVHGVARGKLRLVYLTERGASGNVYCSSIDLDDGKLREKILSSNETDLYLFFPEKSSMVSDYEMVLLGMGNPNQNDFKLFTVIF